MAGVLFVIVMLVAGIALSRLTNRMGCGWFTGGLVIIIGLALLITWLEDNHLFR